MELHLLAFSDRGFELAKRIAGHCGGTAVRCGGEVRHSAWTQEHFGADALVYVGACGIAVRSISPLVKNKTTDPAVLVIDEAGHYVIPILSGHLGGANDLAREVAGFLGAEAVITTATDISGLWAVDEWAKRQDMAVVTPKRIVHVSSKILRGETIRVECPWKIAGKAPEHLQQMSGEESFLGLGDDSEPDVQVTIYETDTLSCVLAPRALILGVGCRKDTPAEAIEDAFRGILETGQYLPQSFAGIATIDIKKEEPGLLAFAEHHGLPLVTYSAEELKAVPGEFSASAFVAKTVGVDNVCERSAALASDGELLIPKQAGNGVTMAVAMKKLRPSWNWQ